MSERVRVISKRSVKEVVEEIMKLRDSSLPDITSWHENAPQREVTEEEDAIDPSSLEGSIALRVEKGLSRDNPTG